MGDGGSGGNNKISDSIRINIGGNSGINSGSMCRGIKWGQYRQQLDIIQLQRLAFVWEILGRSCSGKLWNDQVCRPTNEASGWVGKQEVMISVVAAAT
jgi:hypothetical protein